MKTADLHIHTKASGDALNEPEVAFQAAERAGLAAISFTDHDSFARLLAPRVICTHLHDNDGSHDLHLAPFKGVIAWDRLINEFVKSGYGGDFTFESWGDIRPIVIARERIRNMSAKPMRDKSGDKPADVCGS